jgi:uncharacterized protein (TIGR02145 family)
MKTTLLTILTILTVLYSLKAQTVTDYDGNIYNTVAIGDQTWMKENLKVTHYLNGDSIPNVSITNTWRYLTTGALCDFNNLPINSLTYGKLYNWYAATDARHTCPLGWRTATDADWSKLTRYLDNTVDTTVNGWSGTVIGGKLKETGTAHWLSPNTGANDSSGFTALPGGYRSLYGDFYYLTYYGYWWSPRTNDLTNVWKRNLNYDNSQISRSYNNANYKTSGFSIRCIQEYITTSTHNDHKSIDVQIFPNPATERFTISIPETDGMKMSIYNLLGEVVLVKELKSARNEIETGFLNKGMYIIKLSNNTTTLIRKLTLE